MSNFMKQKQNKTWFDVDRAGLAKILKRKGIEFAVFELIQNAWDEAGVTRVQVTLRSTEERGHALLNVTDDAPEGFKDLRHAYTLFAESEKKANAEKRGRFNIGEKLVLSLCVWAKIITTKGTVLFEKGGRRETAAKIEHGTQFEALIRMSEKEVNHVLAEVTKLIQQPKIVTTINDKHLTWRACEKEFTAGLDTEIADAEGNLKRGYRKTKIRCYAVLEGEKPRIYEMGIPVVEHDCAFHVDVLQKVPLTLDRDNVTVGFLTQLRTAVFNETHADLDVEDVNHKWAQAAIESGKATPAAVTDYMGKRFGELRASYDPTDPEANHAAVANGYTLVHGSMLTKGAWENVRAAAAITPAGRIFPTHSDTTIPTEMVDPDDAMQAVATYTKALGALLMGFEPTVRFTKQPSREIACYGGKTITFNVRNLGKRWFDLAGNRLAIDDLVVHEFGHEYESNHLSEKYNDALTRLAAKAMQLGREGRLP
jgi:hypothetical protein